MSLSEIFEKNHLAAAVACVAKLVYDNGPWLYHMQKTQQKLRKYIQKVLKKIFIQILSGDFENSNKRSMHALLV
jgi:hypothetical protein